jgi:tRNA (guanine37-N1)-methyltransferase
LATQWDVAQHLRVRLKVIRKYHEVVAAPISSGDHPSPPTIPTPPKHVEQAKFIVLHPDTPKISNLPIDVQTILQQMKCHDTDDILPAPFVIQFQYHQFTASYLLNQLLPPKVHPVPTAFETVGHVAHLNLKPHHLPYRIMIGEILYETLPNIETVIQKIGDVSGPYRTFHYEVLAGKHNHTYVKLTENGVHLQFDIQHVYWCSRLAEERQRLLQQEIFAFDPTPTLPPHAVKNKYISSSSCTLRLQCHKPTVIADVFCGVGALCIQAALVHSPNVEIWANDWNPHATDALQKNAIRNGVIHQFTRITTIDAYQFLMDLGMMTPSPPASSSIPPAPSEPNTVPPTDTDIKMAHSENEPDQSTPKSHKVHARRRYHRKKDLRTDVVNHSSRLDGKIRLPDHVVMNFPLMAPSFLGALRWWPANACGDGNHDNQSLMNDDVHTTHRNGLVQPRIHVYTFAKNSVSSSSGSTGSNANLYDDAEDDDDPGNDVGIIGRSVEDIAVDLVAENLLPQLSPNQAVAGTLDNTSIQHPPNRRQELNDIYHCNVRTHIVRDVAPGKVVVCVSFTVTSKLLRHMRGDFL